MTRCVTIVLCMLALSHQTQRTPPTRITPVDEGAANPSFNEFRQRLLQAVQQRNLAEVLAFTSADVQVTLAGRRGIPALKRIWQIDRSPQRFFDELETVLKLGGRFSESSCTFVAPYVWTEFPDSLFEVDYVVVLQDSSPILTQPGTGSPVSVTSTGDLLTYGLGRPGWMRVKTPDGKNGYIKETSVRKPDATRAYFTRIMEEWRLVGFFAGVG